MTSLAVEPLDAPPGSPLLRALHRIENGLLVAILAAMVVLPIGEILLRGSGIPSTILLVQQLTLAVGFVGAAIASRERRHLSLSPLVAHLPPRMAFLASIFSAATSGCVALFLALGSTTFVQSLVDNPTRVQGIPIWILALPLPVGFFLVALRQVLAAGHDHERQWSARLWATGLVAAAASVAILAGGHRSALVVPGIVLLLLAVAAGAPLFSLLGGAALLLFAGAGTPIAAIASEAYRLVVSPNLPTLPLFTLAGYLLAEGGSATRLVRFFRALFGWMPGGLAIAAAVACAFFTSFTGGSGITILALGGLFLPALLKSGHGDRYSVGLLTAGGSLGLLFPPSLPVIMYGVVSRTPIPELFAGAFVPGMLLVGAIVGSAYFDGRRLPPESRSKFLMPEALAATWAAKWELLLPVVVLTLMFGGIATIVQAAAITAAYAFFVEVIVHRDLNPTSDVPRVFVETGTVIGGVLTILGCALGLTSYLVDAQVPALAADWVTARIHSKVVFLLALNVFLLIVGCLMDIFSAIVVVVPIIVPVAAAFGVEPVHLGVIFLANLELGYLTPPVGLNLFLASYRFKRPLSEVYSATLPFLLLLLAVVLIVTYVPWFTTIGQSLLN